MKCKRWQPIYDFDELQEQIKNIIQNDYKEDFYTTSLDIASLFQGDIVVIDKKFVYLNQDGKHQAEYFSEYYMIIGNSCDFDRSIKDLPYTNIIPLQRIEIDIPKDILNGLKKFQNYKHMYLPNFDNSNDEYFIDFTKIMTVSKEYLLNQNISSIKIAELTFESWILLHACIVRYFARDDGRHD